MVCKRFVFKQHKTILNSSFYFSKILSWKIIVHFYCSIVFVVVGCCCCCCCGCCTEDECYEIVGEKWFNFSLFVEFVTDYGVHVV